MKFTALKTRDGGLKGDIFFYRRILHVSRQGFYQYPANKDRPWKYRLLADAMVEIPEEDDCNDTCGRVRVSLLSHLPHAGSLYFHILHI